MIRNATNLLHTLPDLGLVALWKPPNWYVAPVHSWMLWVYLGYLGKYAAAYAACKIPKGMYRFCLSRDATILFSTNVLFIFIFI